MFALKSKVKPSSDHKNKKVTPSFDKLPFASKVNLNEKILQLSSSSANLKLREINAQQENVLKEHTRNIFQQVMAKYL